MPALRQFNLLDKLLIELDSGLRTVFATVESTRPNPAFLLEESAFSAAQQRKSAGLMRVNHAGEVCAQALYRAQSVFARSDDVEAVLAQASQEEMDHLSWTHKRLVELNSHRSYLNVFWYTNAFFMGLLVSLLGDRWSLGFVEETEKQVTQHLQGHLGRLPDEDLKSRSIVETMREDEQRHSASASQAGAWSMPEFIKCLMAMHAKMMTTLAYYI